MREHVGQHWQTWLARQWPNSLSVAAQGRANLSCQLHVQALEQLLSCTSGRVQIVAHSAGCLTVCHWAAMSVHVQRVQSALLVAPPDFDVPLPEGYPGWSQLEAAAWIPSPRQRLPFVTWVGRSSNDPLARPDAVGAMANSWGARIHELGALGHVNPASGHGPWPEVISLLCALSATADGGSAI